MKNDKGHLIAYRRVSSFGQNDERQLADMGFEFDEEYSDTCSGGSKDRPELERMISHARSGDTVYVHSIDRLARNLSDLKSIVGDFQENGIKLIFVKESLVFSSISNSMTDLLLNMLGAVAEFEKSMINERQREGIAKAKEKGTYKGRVINRDLHTNIERMLNDGISIRKIALELSCSTTTVQKIKKSLQ